jgi:hypothetical protein
MTNVEFKINLPKYLADWLIAFSKETGNSPDDFIISVLHRYYDAWKIGRDIALARINITTVPDIDSLVEEYRKKYKKSYIGPYIVIINHFTTWIKERKIHIHDLSKDTIEEFLAQYVSSKNLKNKTLQRYKHVLNNFIKFIKESTTQSGERPS